MILPPGTEGGPEIWLSGFAYPDPTLIALLGYTHDRKLRKAARSRGKFRDHIAGGVKPPTSGQHGRLVVPAVSSGGSQYSIPGIKRVVLLDKSKFSTVSS